jgi:ribonuclease R
MRITKKRIFEILNSSRKKVLSLESLSRRLGIKKRERAKLKQLLYLLEKEGKILKIPPNRFALFDTSGLIKGKIQRFKDGYGFLLRESEPDIFIPPPFMKGALTGDEVLVKITREKPGSKPEGRVVKILRRERREFIGTYKGSKKGGIVIPNDPTLSPEIEVPKGGVGDARDGDKVVFHLIHGRRRISARIVEVLGRADDPKIDVIIVIKKFGLPQYFPEEVEEEVKGMKGGISRRIISRRLNLTDDFIFTIDPAEAKDFDDAISIERFKGGYKLGVHIADVSHYVKEGTAVDMEARDRGTSVYLIDTVIPMLPHKLSGDICSLIPGKKRLAFSIFLIIDADGEVIDSKFENSVIESKARLTYSEAQRIMDGEDLKPPRISIFEDKNFDIIREKLLIARELASKLRYKRWERGSLDFDLPEPEIILLPSGGVADVKPAERLETHRIIEDFMILANERIAQFMDERNIPTIYRIHEPPKPEKIREFLILAQTILGIPVPLDSPTPKSLQKILEGAKGKEEEPLLNYILLRSLMRARYSAENRGHFGLATPLYLHFTSPIRRYPDLVVHRILKRALKGRVRRDEEWIGYLEETASLASTREERAEACEFDLIDLKKLEFMKDKLGEVFEGIITHLTPSGFFVEIKSYLTEGFVSLDSLGGIFNYVPERYLLEERGGRGRIFKIGQKLKVMVVKVDKPLRRLDFVVVD